MRLHIHLSQGLPVFVLQRLRRLLAGFEPCSIRQDPDYAVAVFIAPMTGKGTAIGLMGSEPELVQVSILVRSSRSWLPKGIASNFVADLANPEDRLCLLGVASRIAAIKADVGLGDVMESLPLLPEEQWIVWISIAGGCGLTETELNVQLDVHAGWLRRWLRKRKCQSWKQLCTYGSLLRTARAMAQHHGSLEALSEVLEFSTNANFQRFVRKTTGLIASELRRQDAVVTVSDLIRRLSSRRHLNSEQV